MAIAAARPGGQSVEIVSVDSAQVYRGMDVGTAKPSSADRATVEHHLIDLIDPVESYSAGRFVVDAQRAIDEIRTRGALPLLVGGTMLYFRMLEGGLDPMPVADMGVRAAIEAEARQRGWPALHAELAQVDPASAARLAPADRQRVQRALEVYRSSGRPLSSFHRERRLQTPAAALISLEPADRAWLHRRIAERFEAMLAHGLVAEVEALRRRGDLNANLPSMRCVGYRQTWEALERDELGQLPDRGIAATRQLAKRQLTWLRSMPQRQVVASDAADAVEQVVAAAVAFAA